MNFNPSALHLFPIVLCFALVVITLGLKEKIKPYKLRIAIVAIIGLLVSSEIIISLLHTNFDPSKIIVGLIAIASATTWFFSAVFKPVINPCIHSTLGTHDDETSY